MILKFAKNNYFKLIVSILYTCYCLNLYSNNYIFETEQRSHPKVGSNGAVATQEQYATDVGINILKQGGNAIDAAVAIGYALAVTLPRAGNLGGGGFMTIWVNKDKKSYIVNYRETAPGKINIDSIKSLDKDEFVYSYKASGVPGTVAGMSLALSKFGSMSLKDVIAPAIKLAKDGFNITETHLESLKFAKERLIKDPEASKIFYKSTPELKYADYKLGEKLIQEDLANTLQLISDTGPESFYNGKIAHSIIEEMQRQNGIINKKDLINYKAEIVEPVISTYKNYKIIAPPPPSSGGVTLAQILKLAEKINIERIKPNNGEYYHYLTEIFNYSFHDRNYALGDPRFVDNNIAELLSDTYLDTIAKNIKDNKHTPSKNIDSNNKNWSEGDNTTHYVVIDKDLNIVSNTYTLNYSFGTGKIIPGTGFFMNNELDDFTINLDKPNAYGLIQGEKNLLAPAKQPLSSMTPIIVLDSDNNPVLATGSPGGSRIITTVAQVLLNNLVYNYNISSSVNMPRIHSQLWPDKIFYEDGVSSDTIKVLNKMGHITEKTNAMGSAQTIAYNQGYFMSIADSRRAGAKAISY